LNFSLYSNHLPSVISKGVSEPRVFISGRVALERPCVYLPKQKVPRPYSGALPIHAKGGREWEPDGAPSWTGTRDDDLFDKDRH
jgi:hypothetical protein